MSRDYKGWGGLTERMELEQRTLRRLDVMVKMPMLQLTERASFDEFDALVVTARDELQLQVADEGEEEGEHCRENHQPRARARVGEPLELGHLREAD